MLRFSVLLLLCVLLASTASGKPAWSEYAKKSDDWYRSEQGRRTIENVLSWQDEYGAWPKNLDTSAEPFKGDRKTLKGTFDNAATTQEIRFLAQAYKATKERRYLDAVNAGLDVIFKAQYPTGGWPQSYPPDKLYHRHITFNDDAMVRLMRLLRDVGAASEFDFVDTERRATARRCFDAGVRCILNCQIKVDGKLTVWCAQHDEKDYSPRQGRAFELVSLSGAESAGILELLMEIESPSPEVVRAVTAGAEWFERSKVYGIKESKTGNNLRYVKAEGSGPLWARFYEIETNRPIFSGRDSVKKYDFSEIETERANGYRWYGGWGERVAKAYAAWKEKNRSRLSATDDAEPEKPDAVAAADGSGQFKTVQAAIDAAPNDSPKPFVVLVRAGVYKELIVIPREKKHLKLIGQSGAKVVLTNDLNANRPGADGKPLGTFRTASTVIEADDFEVQNITFENSFGVGSQALAVRVTGDRCVFRECKFLGWQDTVLLDSGRQYFRDCFIAGHVDFIFGGATAVFDRCVIHCLAPGYITAASTPENQPYGFVFRDCKITGEPNAKKSYLGRPWRPFAAVAFLNTTMDDVIRPEGWHNWGDPAKEKTARFVEYKSVGAGANEEKRVLWTRRLADDKTQEFSAQNVLKGRDNWTPPSISP